MMNNEFRKNITNAYLDLQWGDPSTEPVLTFIAKTYDQFIVDMNLIGSLP